MSIANRQEIKFRLSALTSSRHYETNAELDLHSMRFALSITLRQNTLTVSRIKLLFLPDTNSSEQLSLHFALLTLDVNENESSNRIIKIMKKQMKKNCSLSFTDKRLATFATNLGM